MFRLQQLGDSLKGYLEWNLQPPSLQIARQLIGVGSSYGGYHIDMTMVPEEPVIYSVGIGKDISFDVELIHKYGYSVYGFDPTPEVQIWLQEHSPSPRFRFIATGLADFDGEADFHLPPRPDFISHSMVRASQYSHESVRLPVMKLSTIMRTLGHTRIDVLKMDIEGAEYSVIDDLMRDNIEIGQLLIEFHHRLSSTGTQKTRVALSALNAYGMKIAHVCSRMQIFTLVRSS